MFRVLGLTCIVVFEKRLKLSGWTNLIPRVRKNDVRHNGGSKTSSLTKKSQSVGILIGGNVEKMISRVGILQNNAKIFQRTQNYSNGRVVLEKIRENDPPLARFRVPSTKLRPFQEFTKLFQRTRSPRKNT